jgi:hypothetical protein
LKPSDETADSADGTHTSEPTLRTGRDETTRAEIESRPATSSPHSPTQFEAEPPSDAELERAIVQAVTASAFDVARTLATQLEERRRARAGNVVALTRREPTSR